MGLEDRNGLSRLHQQRLIKFEFFERIDDRPEILPRPSSLACAAIDDQVRRISGDFGIEIVH